jgi:hypothetical protein
VILNGIHYILLNFYNKILRNLKLKRASVFLYILYRQQLEHPSAKMNILEKHRRFLKILRFCFYYCGCEVFDTDFKFNFRTLSSMLVVGTYHMCAFNTFFVWPTSYALECLATYGIALTVRSQRQQLINIIIIYDI